MSEISFDTKLLGQGAFSTVHACRFKAATLALKMTPQLRQIGDKQREEFRNEMEILKSLNQSSNNPHIVRLVAVNASCLAMLFTPLVPEGRTLSHVVHEKRQFDAATVLRLLGNCASALSVVHAAGFCHLDFKPLNVLVTGEGEFACACLCDFGISKSGEGQTCSLAGTPSFMPPEAAEGVYGPANDVFAFGVTLWECMAQEIPFAGMADSRDIRNCWLSGTPRGLNEFKLGDGDVRKLFKRCTEIQKDERMVVRELVNWFVMRNAK